MIGFFTKNEYIIFVTTLVAGTTLLAFIYFNVYGEKGVRAFYWGGGDSGEYLALADNVLAGRGFSIHREEPYEIGATRTPGYPLIVAFTKYIGGGRSIFLLILFQVAALGFIGALSYRLMKKFISDKAAFSLSFLIILHPQMLLLALTIMSDIFFIFFFLLSLNFLLGFLEKERGEYFYAALFLLGISTIIRPSSIPFFLIYLLSFPYRHWQKKSISIVAIGFLLFFTPLVPWSLRNHRVFGTFRLSSADTYNLYYVTAPTTLGIRDKMSREEALKLLHEHMLQFPGFTRGRAHDTFIYSVYMQKEAKKIILGSPLSFLTATAREIPIFLFQTEWATPLTKWRFIQEQLQNSSVRSAFFDGGIKKARNVFLEKLRCGTQCAIPFIALTLGFLFWVTVFLFAAIGICDQKTWDSVQRKKLSLFLMLIVVTILLHASLINTPNIPERYKLVVLPLLLIFAWFGWKKAKTFSEILMRGRVVAR